MSTRGTITYALLGRAVWPWRWTCAWHLYHETVDDTARLQLQIFRWQTQPIYLGPYSYRYVPWWLRTVGRDLLLAHERTRLRKVLYLWTPR